jgi:hypothetical protein
LSETHRAGLICGPPPSPFTTRGSEHEREFAHPTRQRTDTYSTHSTRVAKVDFGGEVQRTERYNNKRTKLEEPSPVGFFLVLVDPFQKDGSEEKGEKGERERKRKEKEKKESERRNGGRKNESTGESASSFCCFCCLYLCRSLTRVLLNCFLQRPPATNFVCVAPPTAHRSAALLQLRWSLLPTGS